MPFGILSEDFHGGFGIPEDEICVINYDDTDGEQDDYDPYTGKYAFCEPTAKELAEQDVCDRLAEALAETDAENHALIEDRKRLIFALKQSLEWLDYFLTTEPDDIYHDEACADRWAIECMLMDMEEE